jgi:hypothetical protein
VDKARESEKKADVLQMMEGSSAGCAMAKYSGHHRSLRAGHAVMGVAWELGRSNCLLVKDAV